MPEQTPTFGSHRLPPAPPRPLQGAPKTGFPGQPLSAPIALTNAPTLPPPLRVTPPEMPPLPAIPAARGPVMPALPAIPPANPWLAKRNPSAQLVQSHYIETRLEEMEASSKPGRQAALDVLYEMLLERLDPSKKRKIKFKELMRVYNAIERNLQSADLTINFGADAWFTEENPYDTYTQMYERAMERGTMVLRSTPMNDARARAEVDNQVSFPDDWKSVETKAQRGLTPGRQGADRIMRQMNTGNLVPAGNPADKAFHASESFFNPRTKQIFLGLNYGRRPHGSAVNFGRSYFVFDPAMKAHCMYYGGDTFMHRGGKSHAGTIQYAYDNLGAIMGSKHNGDFLFRSDIFKSCYEGQVLGDIASIDQCKFYLLEAHHFGELKFRDHVEYLVISPKGISDPSQWPQIVENARKFSARLGIKLFQTD